MAHLLALLGNDPTLLHCQVHRVRDQVHFGAWDALGLGYYADDAVLVAKRPGDVGRNDVAELTKGLHSPALVAMAQGAGFRFDEDATDPFRFRRWLFAMDGAMEGFSEAREKLLAELPDLISRQIRSTTDREHVFALFLRYLKERGRLDDPNAPASDLARCLGDAIRTVDRLEREQGLTRPSPLALVATNGRSLVAARRGRPLFYRLQEGAGSCEPCEMSGPNDPRAGAHRRTKAVILATEPEAGGGFIEVPESSTVAVGRSLDINIASI
ncbi:class II glutamine amidotransferase [Vulgatibacter sp.]|uniref:class II glutamine amidotransferase n=1 Tax=Vulgatibacter sp. TaxID=1971226 RepID=UPI003562872B